MNFIHFWRLVKEKGSDLIVESLVQLSSTTLGLPGNFYIFGEGELKKSFLEKFSQYPFFEDSSLLSADEVLERVEMSNLPEAEFKIYLFWWQSQETIRRTLEVSHFALMPSRFLETFWLSAIESLAEWVPVIGFAKGGLVPFILPELSIPFSDDEWNISALTEVVLRAAAFEWDDWKKLSDRARHISARYTEDRWMDEARLLCSQKNPDAKKILLMTDYQSHLGGIETHVFAIARVLRSRGYAVEIFGWEIQKGKWTRLQRLLGLVLSCYNFVFARKLRRKLKAFDPDIVWFHSVSRFLGPLCIQEAMDWSKRKNAATLITYHDLGLWSAFPSIVEKEEMIPLSPGFRSFIYAVRTKNPIRYLAMLCKYAQVSMLRKHIREIDLHIVPSAFLVSYVRDVSEVPETKIHVLELFL